MKIKPKYRGILFILFSALSFSCMSVCVRLSGDVPTMQKCFFRNIVALVVSASVLIKAHESFLPRDKHSWPDFLVRAAFGTAGLMTNYYCVDHLVLSDASMLNKTSPFFAVIASFFILKEKIKPVQAMTLVGAFLGALCIIKPSVSNILMFPALVGLSSGLFNGIAYTAVRKLGKKGESGSLIVFIFSVFSTLVTVPFVLFNFSPMTAQQVMLLLGAGFFAAVGQFGITAAYCSAPAREISVYDYCQVIFTAILGFIVFGDVPDILSVVGYILICSMAVINFRYSNRPENRI